MNLAASSSSQGIAGRLATVTSQAENAFIANNLLPNTGIYDTYWLGGFYNESNGQWKWITGEAWSYANWDSGEPNNLTSEHCVEMYGAVKGGVWNNLSWDNSAVSEGYIVEYAVPEPTVAGLLALGTLAAVHRRAQKSR